MAHPPKQTRLAWLVTALALGAATACHHGPAPDLLPAGEQQPDKYLYDHGTSELATKHWIAGREYFEKLINTYPQSPYRADAKLGVGDAYMGEKRIDADILAANQFREFLQYFPLNARADYAQYQICVADSRQILGPERDQTATEEAMKQIDAFLATYPSSQYKPSVETLKRQAQDRLSAHEYVVGYFEYRVRAYGGAVRRFEYLLKQDPTYPRRDDVYFYLAETYLKQNLKAAAVPYYNKLLTEFPSSKHIPDVKK